MPAVVPPVADAQDRGSFWFFYFRLRAERLRCSRNEFVDALRAEGVACSPGYIPVPIYRQAFFQKHSYFAARVRAINSRVFVTIFSSSPGDHGPGRP